MSAVFYSGSTGHTFLPAPNANVTMEGLLDEVFLRSPCSIKYTKYSENKVEVSSLQKPLIVLSHFQLTDKRVHWLHLGYFLCTGCINGHS
jgi:hypothetical protein